MAVSLFTFPFLELKVGIGRGVFSVNSEGGRQKVEADKEDLISKMLKERRARGGGSLKGKMLSIG